MTTLSNADLAATFVQFAQKCTICTSWLMGDEELATDPSHPWQTVHKDCIYSPYLDSDDDLTDNHITGPNSKKRTSPRQTEKPVTKKQKK